jgi:P4 family phage/plasmid primase-like protien
MNTYPCGVCKLYHSLDCYLESEEDVKRGNFQKLFWDVEGDCPAFELDEEKWEKLLEEMKKKGGENLSSGPGPEGEGEGEGEKLNLYLLAKSILEESPIHTDIRTYLMFRWDGKIWRDDAEGYIHEKLAEAEGEDYKPYHLTTLKQIVQGLSFVYEFEEPPKNLICFENGILDLNTLELQPHNPKYFFRNMVHAKYDPNAKCPKFLEWLNEVLPDEKSRLLAQEIFGYCFYRDYPLHHIFFIVGSGRNGKGTFARTLEAILGKESCARINLERLDERFQATNLWGKLANIVTEPDIKRFSTEIIKSLSGQDLISGEVKGKQKLINFTNYAKIIVVANQLPRVDDKSLAWWERVILLEFPIVIPEEKRIPNIEERWLNDEMERGGVVNWALEGLKRLLQNRRFTKSETMVEKVEEYKRWSNPVDYFLEKRCVFEVNAWIPKKELYEAYKDFCEEEDLKIVSEEAFGSEVKKKPKVRTARKMVEGQRIWVWEGVKLKEEGSVQGVQPVQASIYLGKLTDNDKILDKILEGNIEPRHLGQVGHLDASILKDDKEPRTLETLGTSSVEAKYYYCRTCLSGPWKERKTTLEHLALRPGHEIAETNSLDEALKIILKQKDGV